MYTDQINCAIAVVLGFFVPGLLQTAFLNSSVSERFAQPIDGGMNLRGARLFGDNKTWRGFVVIIPAVTVCFAAIGVGQAAGWLPGLWPLGVSGWVFLGAAAAVGYTAGELPNSFVKRRLGIRPGGAPDSSAARALCYVVDQLDSVVAALVVISAIVPTGWLFWVICLGVGALLHVGFNVVLHALGVKERPA